jgi:hypothetical protein
MSEQMSSLKIDRKSLEDIQNIDDLSYDIIDAQKGETPVDIRGKCLRLCQEHLGGVWLEQTIDTIQLRRISGGLTNQLYYCSVAQPSAEAVVPEEVAIRLYGLKYINNEEENERLTDVITALMVSDMGLGPKIYGIFEQGQIQAFYKVN